jgi:hypothetical protein
MKNLDWITQILIFLALLMGLVALGVSDIPSFIHQEVIQLVVSWDDRYHHKQPPTVPAGNRGGVVEEESLVPSNDQ